MTTATHAWDARQLAHGLREVAHTAAKTLAHLREDEPRDDRRAADVWRRDLELTAWVNRWVAGAGSPSVLGWCEAQELVDWSAGEGHDVWPAELCAPPPIITTCSCCKQQFSKAHWQSLRWECVWRLTPAEHALSMRTCYCGSSSVVDCVGANAELRTFRPPETWTDEQRAAKGAEVES